MNQSPLKEEIRSFLTRTFLFEFGPKVSDDTDLFDAGLIDSYGFIELVQFLEQTYGVSLSDEDLASKEMSTLSGITVMISDRRTANRESRQQVP
jgi:acyl carrier protein